MTECKWPGYAAVTVLSLGLAACALPPGGLSAARPAGAPGSSTAHPIGGTPSADSNAPEALSIDALAKNKRLDFRTCLEYALRHNLKVEIAQLGTTSAAQGEKVARARFDPFIGLTGVGYPGDGASMNATEGNAVVSQKLITGTEIRAEAGTAFYSNSDRSLGYVSDQTEAAIRLRQQLLRGAGIAINRAGMDLAKITTKNADATERAEVMEMLRATITAYWTATWAKEALRVQRESLQRTERILQDVNARHAVGAATKIDRLEAESAVAAAKELVERAEQRNQDALSSLTYLLGLTPGNAPTDISLEALVIPVVSSPKPETSYQNALNKNPMEVLLANEVERRTIEHRVAKNALLPGLELEVNAGTTGLFDYDQGISSSSTDSSNDSANWSALLRVSIPWTFRAERAQAEQTRIELERSEIAREDGRRQLRRDIFETCREIDSGHRQLDTAMQALSVNRAKWEEQSIRLQEGLVSVRDLREAEGEFQNASVRELSARLGIIIARARLARLDGSIVERNGMTF
jgi:outer membrane protein